MHQFLLVPILSRSIEQCSTISSRHNFIINITSYHIASVSAPLNVAAAAVYSSCRVQRMGGTWYVHLPPQSSSASWVIYSTRSILISQDLRQFVVCIYIYICSIYNPVVAVDERDCSACLWFIVYTSTAALDTRGRQMNCAVIKCMVQSGNNVPSLDDLRIIAVQAPQE